MTARALLPDSAYSRSGTLSGHDAGPRLHRDLVALLDRHADGNADIHIAGKIQIAHGPAVDTPGTSL